jgi:predicted aspartyl protease
MTTVLYRDLQKAMKRLALPVALAVLAPSVARADEGWPAECKLALVASLPFSIKHGHVIVAVEINGVPRSFVIDTGGFLSSVTAKVAEDQGLKTHEISDHLSITGIGGERAKRYAIADTLMIGRLRASDVRLVVQPQAPDGEDGVLAPEYLRNFDLDFDFANHTLNLFRPHPCNDHVVYWTNQFTALPLDVTAQGHIRMLSGLDGKEMETLIDTGSPTSLIGALAASRFDVDTSTMNLTIHGVTGGSTSASMHRFHSLKLGNIDIQNPPLIVAKDGAGWRDEHCDLLLGLLELSKFHVYVAYNAKTIYLSPIVAGQMPAAPPP